MAGLGDFTGKVKGWEGFNPKPYWDYRQWTSGYGTRASGPDEVIDQAEADRRLSAELAKARSIVDQIAPNAPEGWKQALTSLTFNAGDKWSRSGLGDAIRRGDWDDARNRFGQYNKAGGEVLPGLARRRQEELAFVAAPSETTLAHSAPSGDFFAGQALGLTGSEIPGLEQSTPPGMMALGGPNPSEIPSSSPAPFNAQSYRVSPERQKRSLDYGVNTGAEWIEGPLGLMPKYSDGQTPLQGFKDGGRVGLGALSVSTPTEAQKEAGNYKKAHVKVQGLDITIENPKGSERSGTDKGGRRWSVKMPDHYGYFKRTLGKDGDHVDCYVGPDVSSSKAFVVDQIDAGSGKFDEHKVMLGYPSKDAALTAYRKAFSDNKADDRIGGVTEVSVDGLKTWLSAGNTKVPMARKGYAHGGVVSGGLHSDVAGRTDHLPLDVMSGSFVVPADIVSSLGEGNTIAGLKILDEMFPKQASTLQFSSGGRVPIMAAGGEYVLSPEQVAAVGAGDLARGQDALDAWILAQRAHTIQTLQSLPGPAKT